MIRRYRKARAARGPANPRRPLVAAALAGAGLLLVAAPFTRGDPPAGFQPGPAFGERVREERLPTGVRIVTNLPRELDPDRPTRVVFYATPNGNTIEQTLGASPGPGVDWHFDIQHVAAQTRAWRAVDARENLVLVCLEADQLSWPAWRREHPDSAAQIRGIVEKTLAGLPLKAAHVTLTGHSGGGSFLFGFIDGHEALPAVVDRIAFLDANYSFAAADRHGDKLLAWLEGDAARRLVVIAYDDRNITLDGKPVVGPTGGTYRATERMVQAFGRAGGETAAPKSEVEGPFNRTLMAKGRALFLVHPNPQNKILHTALVGEMNGYLYAMTWGTAEEKAWGAPGGPRAYAKWIAGPPPRPPASLGAPLHPSIPARPPGAGGGAAFMERIADLPGPEREAAVLKELRGGNVPDFLRRWVTVEIEGLDTKGAPHRVALEVMPDYLSVGSDADFVRVPMTPQTAQSLADAYGCTLPTRKMVDAIWRQAAVKLEPRPLTMDRESTRTFLQHNRLIEGQWRDAGAKRGELVAGIKKDVVVTPLLPLNPGRVAIYGWHHPDGRPIQPLTTVHAQFYVDYSHGVRLVGQTALVDGKPVPVAAILKDAVLHPLLSDEGVIEQATY